MAVLCCFKVITIPTFGKNSNLANPQRFMLKIQMFTFNPVQENTYVIFNEEGACAIVDPGCYFDHEYKELTDFIHTNNLVPKCLLNTHCHLDHVFGNKRIAERYNLQLQMHPNEKKLFDYAPASGDMWGLPFKNYEGPIIYINESEKIKLGNDELDILLTPGHSPGSLTFYNKEAKFVLSATFFSSQASVAPIFRVVISIRSFQASGPNFLHCPTKW